MKSLLAAALIATTLTASTQTRSSGAAMAVQPPVKSVDCEDVAIFDTVYQRASGSGKFDYYFQLRNKLGKPIEVTVEVGNMPDGVSVFSRTLPGIKLAVNHNENIKFASGTSQKISNDTVKRYYGAANSTTRDAYVVAKSCKQ